LALTDVTGGRRSYVQIASNGARLANTLLGHGLVRGDRVIVYVDDTVDCVEIYLGIWLAGCTAVHANYRLQPPELAHQITDSYARAIIYSSGRSHVVEAVADPADLGFMAAVGEPQSAVPSLAELLKSARTTLPPSRTTSTDLAMIGYTSGTTGKRKGAMISNAALVAGCQAMSATLRIAPDDRMAYMASVSFVATLWSELFPQLLVGGVVHMLAKDRDRWLDILLTQRVTSTNVASPLIPELIEHVRRNPGLLDHLRTVLHGGAPAPRRQVAELVELIGGRYLETWGMTETTGSVSATTPADYEADAEIEDVLGTVGRGASDVQVHAVDPDGQPLEPGLTGELVVHTRRLFSGYWGDEEKTRSVLRDGALWTGDVGYVDAEGYIYLKGRAYDVIISGGANVYPAEVEAVLIAMPEVAQVAVLGAAHPRWGETVVAAVVAKEGHALDEMRVRAYARERLAAYKVPTSFVMLGELPLNGSQKVDKAALAQLIAR
jgi:acyl-CoA synthetase (AMP-forming)/AMP-acid ligase II